MIEDFLGLHMLSNLELYNILHISYVTLGDCRPHLNPVKTQIFLFYQASDLVSFRLYVPISLLWAVVSDSAQILDFAVPMSSVTCAPPPPRGQPAT